MNKLLLLIIAVALHACIFNDSILPDNGCVSKILIRETVVNEVKYNKQNRPVEIIDNTSTDESIAIITYKNGNINQINSDSYYGKFTADIVFLADNKVQLTNHLKTDDFEYLLEFKNNLPVKLVRWWKNSPNATYESIFSYDSNDNLQKIDFYEVNTHTTTVEYSSFDDKKNFYYGNPVDWAIIGLLKTINYGAIRIPTSRNNPRSYKITQYDSGKVTSTYNFNFDYQYNDNGYVIAAKETVFPEFEAFIEYKK